jgi:hypothetical protein
MTSPPDLPNVTVLADHSVLLAIPAFIPAVVVAGVVVYIAMRDRRRGDETHTENSDASDKDDGS